MKRVLIGIVAVVAILVAAALVVPGFFNWNDYKDVIAAQVKGATGRDLFIGGDIRLTILPAPAVVVEDLRFANIDGSDDDDMLQLAVAEVEIALGPLFGGRFEVRKVRLVEPVILLEVLADGRRNWDIKAPAGQGAEATLELPPAEPAEAAPGTDRALPFVSLDAVEIERGTLIYRNAVGGIDERIDDLNATLRAGSLQGPFEARGRLSVRAVPTTFDVAVGDIAGQNLVPLKVVLGTDAGSTRLDVRGLFSPADENPQFQGRVKLESASLAAAVRGVAEQPLPGFLAQPFVVEGKVDASATRARVEELSLRLGETGASGEIAADLADTPSVAATLAVGRVDLDAWLAMAPAAPPAPVRRADRPAGAGVPSSQGTGAKERSTGGGGLPRDVDAAVTLSVEALSYRGGVIRQLRANAELDGGEVTISQLSALLPGGADVAAFGFVTSKDNEPRFEGQVEARAADLRGVLGWLGIDVADVPSGRLRTLALTSKLTATADTVQARSLDLQVDGSRIKGGVSVALAERRGIGADLTVDRINVDAYLPAAQPPPQPAAGKGTAGGAAGRPPSGEPSAAAPGLAAVKDFDADVKLRIGQLTYADTPMKDVVVDGSLVGGTLTLRRAGVADVAGASAQASGTVRGIADRPTMQGVSVAVDAPDPPRLLGLFADPVPQQARTLGAVKATARLDGPLDAPGIDAAIRAAGGETSLAGTLAPANLAFQGRVGLKYADIRTLLKGLGVDYRPQGPVGPTDVTAEVTADPQRLALSALKGRLAGVTMSGSASVDLALPRPKVVADLATGPLVVDALMPATRTSALGRLLPAFWRPLPPPEAPRYLYVLPAAVHARWSRDPIDLSGLTTLDADLRLRSESLAYGTHRVDAADVTAALAAGVLTVPQATGRLFGGPFNGSARVDARDVPAFALKLSARDAEIGRAFGGTSGRAALDAELTARGRSAAELVSALGGQGRFDVRALDLRLVAGDGFAQAPVMGPTLSMLKGLDAVLGPLLGAVTGVAGAVADISSSVTVEQGVARFPDLRFTTPAYSGTAAGVTDLPAWTIDMEGQITLAPTLVGQLLKGVKEAPKDIRFSARGPLDKPDIRTSGLSLAIPAPGLDRLREDRRIGPVLDLLAPRAAPTEPPAAPPPAGPAAPEPGETLAPPPPPSTAPAPDDPLDSLLRGILRSR